MISSKEFALKLAILTARTTQRALSVELGIPETVMSDIVRRKAIPSKKIQLRLAKRLNCPLESIFSGVSNSNYEE